MPGDRSFALLRATARGQRRRRALHPNLEREPAVGKDLRHHRRAASCTHRVRHSLQRNLARRSARLSYPSPGASRSMPACTEHNGRSKVGRLSMGTCVHSAAPCRRILGGKRWLGGKSCQGRQPPKAGAAGPPLQGLPPIHTRPPRSTAGNISSAGCLKTGPQYTRTPRLGLFALDVNAEPSAPLWRLLPASPTDPQLLEHAVHMRIIDASCTENGSDGGDGAPEGTDSTSVTNRACIAAGKTAKSAAQYWTHRDLKASKFPSPLVRRSPGGSAELLCGSANDGLPVLGIDGPSAFTR